MSNSTLCLQSNPDISGIGVRSAVYAQNLLSFIPALFALSDGVVTQVELETLETQSTTIIISAFALLISTIVQAFNSKPEIRLSNFHATIILNLSWMNNTNLFIYFLLYVHKHLAGLERERKVSPADPEGERGGNASGHTVWSTRKEGMKTALRNPVFILGSAHLTLMAAVGIWFWRRPFSFGYAPSCSQSASVVVLGHQVSLTSEGFKGWSLFVYSLLLVPIFNLVVPVAFFSIPFFIWLHVENRLNLAGRRVPTMFGLIVLVVINIVFLADTEVTLRENSHLVGEGETEWTFGQTLALILLLVPLRDITETLVERRAKTLGKKLLEASARGELQVVEYVYKLGADRKMKDPSLWIAAENGHRDVVRFLLKNGAGVNARDESSQTPLMLAAWQGHSEVVELLLKNGAGVNARDESSQTPLMLAAEQGHSEVIELLLKNNADIEARDQSGYTPLMWAADHGHRGVVELLLKNNANIEAEGSGNTPLRRAVLNGHRGVVELLLKNNVDIEARDESGNTPLQMCAASLGRSEVVDLLLKNNADIEARDRLGNTPLMLAASWGHSEVVELLLKNNADIEARDESGYTPLRLATMKGHRGVVDLLEAYINSHH